MLNIIFTNNLEITRYLSLSNRKVSRFSPLKPSVISINDIFSPERRRVEKFIEDIYAKHYGATITSHYPILMSVRDVNNNIIAALGFRYATKEALFLETYLDEAIESSLSKKFKTDVSRDQIVEVGGLASMGNGASIFLFTALATYLQQQDIEYVSVTATKFLRGYFNKIGLKPKEIRFADNNRLADKGASWGSYYNTEPQVIAGTLSSACKLLKKKLSATLSRSDAEYFARIHKKSGDYSI